MIQAFCLLTSSLCLPSPGTDSVTGVFSLFAVHIPDGNVLMPAWLIAGYGLAGILVLVGSWGIQDQEIPQVALLTAAFFVASLIHVPVPGLPTSAHLLLNGLLGVVLGRRAALAIAMGLFLQAILLQHGGLTTLGVNCCVMALPALLAWQTCVILQRLPGWNKPAPRAALVVTAVLAWSLSLVYGLLGFTYSIHLVSWPILLAILAPAIGLAGLIARAEQRLGHAPEFAIGLLVGETAVLATVLLHCLTLVWGGTSDWRALVVLTLPPHLVIAAVEGVVLGFTVSFLARVKPELLRGRVIWEKTACPADALP
jgi:cobalt/nickel transport system permease protein